MIGKSTEDKQRAFLQCGFGRVLPCCPWELCCKSTGHRRIFWHYWHSVDSLLCQRGQTRCRILVVSDAMFLSQGVAPFPQASHLPAKPAGNGHSYSLCMWVLRKNAIPYNVKTIIASSQSLLWNRAPCSLYISIHPVPVYVSLTSTDQSTLLFLFPHKIAIQYVCKKIWVQ